MAGVGYRFVGSLSFESFASLEAAISSIGFGDGVVAIVHPIHAPIAIIATKAIRTGVAMIQNCVSDAVACAPMFESH